MSDCIGHCGEDTCVTPGCGDGYCAFCGRDEDDCECPDDDFEACCDERLPCGICAACAQMEQEKDMTDTERDTPTLEVSSGGDLNAGALNVLEAAIRERDEMRAELSRLRATVERVEDLCKKHPWCDNGAPCDACSMRADIVFEITALAEGASAK